MYGVHVAGAGAQTELCAWGLLDLHASTAPDVCRSGGRLRGGRHRLLNLRRLLNLGLASGAGAADDEAERACVARTLALPTSIATRLERYVRTAEPRGG